MNDRKLNKVGEALYLVYQENLAYMNKDPSYEMKELYNLMLKLCQDDRDKMVLLMRLNGKSYSDISWKLNLCQERVRTIYIRACKRIAAATKKLGIYDDIQDSLVFRWTGPSSKCHLSYKEYHISDVTI